MNLPHDLLKDNLSVRADDCIVLDKVNDFAMVRTEHGLAAIYNVTIRTDGNIELERNDRTEWLVDETPERLYARKEAYDARLPTISELLEGFQTPERRKAAALKKVPKENKWTSVEFYGDSVTVSSKPGYFGEPFYDTYKLLCEDTCIGCIENGCTI